MGNTRSSYLGSNTPGTSEDENKTLAASMTGSSPAGSTVSDDPPQQGGGDASKIVDNFYRGSKTQKRKVQSDMVDSGFSFKNHFKASYGDWSGFRDDYEKHKSKRQGLENSERAMRDWEDTSYGPAVKHSAADARRNNQLGGP